MRCIMMNCYWREWPQQYSYEMNVKTIICFSAAAFLSVMAACTEESISPAPPSAEPYVVIEQPAASSGTPFYSQYTIFRWRNGENAGHTRYFCLPVTNPLGVYDPSFDMIEDMNENPWRYEDRWTAWKPLGAPDGSGSSAVIGDDEEILPGVYYVFAVQAKNEGGTVTSIFSTNINARRFGVSSTTRPLLRLYEPTLRGASFIGTNYMPVEKEIPPGVPLAFSWMGDASSYGGEIMGFRYGWDIAEPSSWDAPFVPHCTTSAVISFYAGVHTLTVEAVDQMGKVARGSVEITIVPFPMERTLLWVDDFPSGEFPQVSWAIPTESQHDSFWLDICERARGFDPSIDVYDTQLNVMRPPKLDRIGNYKNIIWTYSSSDCSWQNLVYFTPESRIGWDSRLAINYLPLFLMRGGHVWTLGRSDRSGGLAATLDEGAQVFPMSLECEISGNRPDCDGDGSGVMSMPYRDYCVTMLDKIQGMLRTDPEMLFRWVPHFDVMTHAYRDRFDPYSSSHAELPERLELWEEVTRSGRYFDPDSSAILGGFTYVEIYDPAYWMRARNSFSQSCFHPLYRMKAKSEESVLDDCVIALWVTRYENVVPEAADGIAAPSLHFGFPLWFFERGAVDSIVSVVFGEWGIAE
jgi:hypothetical protein